MLLSYRRGWERRIRSSAQTRQKTRPMDVKLHVTILRLHGEYLARLLTEVSTQLGALEQTLSEGNALTSADTEGCLAEVASFQTRLCMEGEMFCKRLHLFVEESKTVHGVPETLRQKTATEGVFGRKSVVIVR
jgi:hypothetical protein